MNNESVAVCKTTVHWPQVREHTAEMGATGYVTLVSSLRGEQE